MARDYVERFTVNNLTVTIEHDEDPESPREWDNLGTMVCWHRRYILGDEQPSCEPSEWLEEHEGTGVLLPLYLYDHGGITMRCAPFACPWDSGQVGYIYISDDKIRTEFGEPTEEVRQKVVDCLKGEVTTYDEYLTGRVYGFVVGAGDDENPIDSCWGFYGLDYCRDEATAAARYEAKRLATDELASEVERSINY